MGATGSGKSTFISYFVEGVEIGHDLMSCELKNMRITPKY